MSNRVFSDTTSLSFRVHWRELALFWLWERDEEFPKPGVFDFGQQEHQTNKQEGKKKKKVLRELLAKIFLFELDSGGRGSGQSSGQMRFDVLDIFLLFQNECFQLLHQEKKNPRMSETRKTEERRVNADRCFGEKLLLGMNSNSDISHGSFNVLHSLFKFLQVSRQSSIAVFCAIGSQREQW
jgi:hypothetical protein